MTEMPTLTDEFNELESIEDTLSDRALGLWAALMAGLELEKMSDKEIANLLLHFIWADMDISGPHAMLVHEAIGRLDRDKPLTNSESCDKI